MKKILLSAVFALLISTLSFASDGFSKNAGKKMPLKKEAVVQIANDSKLEASYNKSGEFICILYMFQDGSYVIVCCETGTICGFGYFND